ncbi:hypothetical protein HY640_00850 [Candidatus Woesearchaeota archaeon]|nr:hypothetical protein [Candidatus Woesearchaeota archaeon]
MRTIYKRRYVAAGVITLAVFVLGLMTGLLVEGKRVDYIESTSRRQNLEFSSLQLQYAFIDQLSQEKNCKAVQSTFERNINNLESTRIRLENFNRDAAMHKEEFAVLTNEYILAQIRYWLLAERTRELCGSDMVNVLYFFSDNDACPTCDEQAFVLTYLKKRLKDRLLVFSFDSNFDKEPMISLLTSTYNVTVYPTVVVEGVPYYGFVGKGSLLRAICGHYKEPDEACEGYMGRI